MSAKDQILSAELHGEALIDHLHQVAQGRDDIRTECAGTIAGSWFAGAARLVATRQVRNGPGL